MTTIQRVKYPYRFIQDSNQVITIDCVPPPIAEQRQLEGNFWMYQTDDDVVTKLSSALATGLRLEYPDEENQLMWNFWEAFACMDLCTAVLQSFLGNEDCQTGLSDLLTGLGFGIGGGGSDTPIDDITDTVFADLGESCNVAELYGICYALIDQMNTMVVDMLEALEVLTNPIEYATVLADNVGILGLFSSTISETVAWIQDTIAENYVGAFTTDTHEELACELFCICEEDCIVTMARLRQAYRDYFTGFLPELNAGWVAFVEDLFELTLSTDTILVAAMQLMVCEALIRGSAWFGGQYRTLEIATAMAPVLAPPEGCGCAEEQCYTVLFGTDNLDGTWSSENSGLSTPHRVQIEWSNFSIGSNEWQFGSIVSGAVNGSPAVRVWEGGAFSGTINETLSYAGALLATPIEGGAVAIISNSAFTINFAKSDASPECP